MELACRAGGLWIMDYEVEMRWSSAVGRYRGTLDHAEAITCLIMNDTPVPEADGFHLTSCTCQGRLLAASNELQQH